MTLAGGSYSNTIPSGAACGQAPNKNGGMEMSGEDFSAEFYGLPEYVITHIRTEKLANGCTRVYHWVERNGHLVPCFMAMIATSDLMVMNEAVQEILLDLIRVKKLAS